MVPGRFVLAYGNIQAGPWEWSADPAVRARGVVAPSSGNHAQGVAAAAKLLGLPALIVMPRDAPALKRERTAAHGIRVVNRQLLNHSTAKRVPASGW